jgi:hypothetical protein
VVLFREAASAVSEVATASVGTLRQRLWKMGAVLECGPRRLVFHVSAHWPDQGLWRRVAEAVQVYVDQVRGRGVGPPVPPGSVGE